LSFDREHAPACGLAEKINRSWSTWETAVHKSTKRNYALTTKYKLFTVVHKQVGTAGSCLSELNMVINNQNVSASIIIPVQEIRATISSSNKSLTSTHYRAQS